jgi:ATP-binding cassette subfamily C protein
MNALGDSGLRYVITLGRILDTSTPLEQPRPVDELKGYQVRLQNLTFAYGPSAEPVLDKLELTIPEGEHLAVVGPSGIGKSTLAGLVCGMLTPTDGRLLVGGAPPTAVTTERLAKTRVLIPQEAYVFSGSMHDNLTYLLPDATKEQIRQAVEAVGATRLIDRLGTQVKPAELSAGEKQLIALVRAYLSPAPLVVLDEATCFLDPEAERQAEEAFAKRDGTLIVIAHRISSALRARRILVLDGNKAVLGTHASLMRTSRLYRDLHGSWTPTAKPRPQSSPQPSAQIQPAS